MDLGVALRELEQDPRADAWRDACHVLADVLACATHLPMGLLVMAHPDLPVWDLVDHLHDLADHAHRAALRPLAVCPHDPDQSTTGLDHEHYPAPREAAALAASAGVGLARVACAGPGESVLVVTDRPLPPAHLAAVTLARGQHACVVGLLGPGLTAESALCEERAVLPDGEAVDLAAHGLVLALRSLLDDVRAATATSGLLRA